MLRINVPATSANLSVGFDTLGISLDLYNTFEVEKSEDYKLEGFDDGFNDPNNNLFIDSYIRACMHLKIEESPIKVIMTSNVPNSRGLGSSATLIVGGVIAAFKVNNLELDKDEIFNIATEIEGHPDNVAPAIYGGMTSAYKNNGKYYVQNYNVSPDLHFLVLIPDYEVKTSDARNVLPKTLTYEEAVNNLSRIVMLPKAMEEGNIELLQVIFNDALHEPYRAKLIEEYDKFKKIALENEAALAISGSGSSMLVISRTKVCSLFEINRIKVGISKGAFIDE